MSAALDRPTLAVALIGNPNTGKSTLFSALAGVRKRVGNYPGVTVEKKIGQMVFQDRAFALVDLPGTYSLAPRSPDEMVAVEVLLGRQADAPPIDAVLCIVDASNLERNLYLVSQVLELGLPTVVALNMTDVARQRGIELDVARLSERLGVPVVETQANKRQGVEQIKTALLRTVSEKRCPVETPFPEPFREEVDRLAALVNGAGPPSIPRPLVERLLLDTSGYLEKHLLTNGRTSLAGEIEAARGRLRQAGFAVPAVEAMARYG